MRFYTYSAPGVRDTSQLTEEIFSDYKECGFNTLMLTGENKYNGEGWGNSNAKKCFDLAKKVGIKEIILDDWRIYELSMYGDKLVGDGDEYKFQSTDQLDEYVKTCLAEYINEPLFLGIRLHDEPFYDLLTSYGLVYRSVKRVAKTLGRNNLYIQINMNPMITDIYAKLCPNKDKDMADAYEYYIDQVFKATGADRLAVDNYPFRTDLYGGRFLDGYYKCFQILRKKCDEYGAEMSFVLQSFEMYHKTKTWGRAGYRRIWTLNQMMMQMNNALGFGVRDISFYTYVTHGSSPESVWRSEDGCSFITNSGEKTHIYNYGKLAIEHAQKLAPTLFNYDYIGSNLTLGKGMEKYSFCYIGCGDNQKADGSMSKSEFDNSYKSKTVKSIDFNKDILLTTELENKNDGTVLCTFQNVLDHIFQTELKAMKLKVDFGKERKKAKYFDGDKFIEIELVDGVFETDLAIGEAAYVIPLKI